MTSSIKQGKLLKQYTIISLKIKKVLKKAWLNPSHKLFLVLWMIITFSISLYYWNWSMEKLTINLNLILNNIRFIKVGSKYFCNYLWSIYKFSKIQKINNDHVFIYFRQGSMFILVSNSTSSGFQTSWGNSRHDNKRSTHKDYLPTLYLHDLLKNPLQLLPKS